MRILSTSALQIVPIALISVTEIRRKFRLTADYSSWHKKRSRHYTAPPGPFFNCLSSSVIPANTSLTSVIPAQAGIHLPVTGMDSRLRGNDGKITSGRLCLFYGGAGQCLVEIGDDVIDMLDAHREPDVTRGNTRRQLLVFRELRMGG